MEHYNNVFAIYPHVNAVIAYPIARLSLKRLTNGCLSCDLFGDLSRMVNIDQMKETLPINLYVSVYLKMFFFSKKECTFFQNPILREKFVLKGYRTTLLYFTS